EVFNVVDDDLPSSRRFLRLYKRHVRRFTSIYVPHLVSYALCALWEKYSYWSEGQLPPAWNRRTWNAYWKKTRYSNARVKTRHAAQAERLVALATERRLELTVGHDDQFSHVARRMRALVQRGYLGGPPLHMEASYCYDLTQPGYARALLADKQHWIRRLPGGL